MRAKILFSLIFALLAGCWVASGQTFIGLPFRPLSSGGVPGPQSISHLRFYWVSTDMTTNATVGVWTDRIQSQNIVSTNVGVPTNYSAGVYFNGSNQRLVITNPFTWSAGTSTGSVWMVMQPQLGASDFASIMAAAVSPFDTSVGYGPMTRTSGVLHWSADGGSANWGSFVENQVIDWSAQFYLTNTSQIWTRITTNNVQAMDSNLNVPSLYVRQIGWRSDISRFYKGYIKEIAFFTNVLTHAEITTLHTYATNTYNFTP
jgi:hypothetical protein